jgi:hypothetical protein
VLVAVTTLFALALVPLAGAPTRASAEPLDNAVLEWNLHAVNAFLNPPTAPTPGAGLPPQVAILHLAMVQGAIYDAVNMIEGGYQPYSSDLPEADADASQAAAIATAARDVIVGVHVVPALSPAIIDRVNQLWEDSINAAIVADGAQAVAAGIAAGEAAAAAMLEARANDGRFVPFALTAGTEPGEWRPALPAFVSDPNAWVGRVDPFVLESTSQFRSKGPHALKTGIYAREYNEVKALGSLTSQRSPEQEAIAQFFVVNPVEMYNRAFRTLAAAEGLTAIEQARLFAMLNMAGADALINCTDDKIHYSFWRPITAIRLGDDDGNPKTVGDPSWTPMLNTPPYSDHSSGYNCVTGAFMHTAEAFFGNGKTDFSLVRIVSGQADVTRDYERFTDVIDDTIDARVYHGLHFRNADVQGAEIGKDVAHWLDKHYFQPVK